MTDPMTSRCGMCGGLGWILDGDPTRTPRMAELLPCLLPDCDASGVSLISLSVNGAGFNRSARTASEVMSVYRADGRGRSMSEPTIEDIEAALGAATPGPWTALWHDPKGEPEHYRQALALSVEADRDLASSSTAYRVRHELPDGDWSNVAFVGNGPTSAADAHLFANAPTWLAYLLARAESAERERDEPLAEVVALREALREAPDHHDHPEGFTNSPPGMSGVWGDCDVCGDEWPCWTMRARALLVQESPEANSKSAPSSPNPLVQESPLPERAEQ